MLNQKLITKLTLCLIILFSCAANAQKAPGFVLSGDNKDISLAKLKGKVVYLDFWASWCVTCKDEARELEEAWRFYQPEGEVVFIGVDYVDTEPEALGYLETYDITYPNGPDMGTQISQAFRIQGVPETYFLDREGIVQHVQLGPFRSTEQIMAHIDSLLAE